MSTTVTGSKRHLNINADEFAGDLNGTVNTATTATTQSTSDNSTKVATTAFVKAQGYGTSNLALGTTSTTALAGNTSIPSISGLASTSYVDTAVANVVDSSPAALNTLNELAAALGDDANYATTTATAIGTKLPLAGGTMTGAIAMGNQNITGAGTITGTTLTGTSLDINGNADIAGNLVIDGGVITIDPDANGSVFIWKESDGTTVAGQLRSYSNRGDIYLYSDGTKKTEISSQSDSFIPKLHIGGTSGASGGVLQTTGDVNIDGNADISGTTNAAVITSTSLTLTNENPSLNFTDSSGSTYSAQWRFKDNTLQYVWGGGIKAYFTTSGLAIGDQGNSNDARIEKTGSSPYGLTFKTNNTSALSLDSSQNATFAGDITLGANHIGRDGHNYIGFETDNLIKFRVNNTTQVKISDGLFAPQNDSDIDLGSNGTRFANVYADTLYGDGSNLTNVSATDSSKLPLAGGTMSGAIAMGDNDVTGLDELIFSNGTKLGDDGADNYLKLTYGDSGAGGILVYDGDGSRQGYLYGDGGVNASFGLLDGTGSWAVRCYENEYVELRYDDSIKLKTSTSGITVTGAVAATTFSGDLNGTINTATTAVTQSAGNNSTKVATTAYADAAVAALIDNAPANLNTLNELAEALNDDDDAIVTINTALGTKLPLAGGTMTGDIILNDNVEVEFGTGSDVKMKFDGSDLVTTVPTGSAFMIGTNGGTPHDNSGKADFVVDVNSSPQISFYSNQFQVGGTDMNWSSKFFYNGSTTNLAAWDNDITIFTQGSGSNPARNIRIKPQAAGGGITTVATFNGDTGTTLSGHLSLDSGGGRKKIKLGSQETYALPAQGTKMRILTLANLTSCRVYMDSSENSYNQPIILEIFYNSQSSAKPVIHRNNTFQHHPHSNDIRFTCDTSGHIYAEKVSYSTGRTVNIRKVEEFKGTVTILDGSTTQTGGGASDVLEGKFGVLTATGKITGTELEGTSLDINGNADIAGNLTLSTNGNLVMGTGQLKFADNGKIYVGDSNDLQIYHDGSHSFIVDNGVGNLWIGSNGGSIYLGDEGANETFLKATDNGSVELYYNNVKKLETRDTGVLVTGELEATSLDINGAADISGDLTGVDTLTAQDFVGTGSYHEFGNATGSVSNNGSWNGRLNVAGTSHARLDVKSVSDSIITTMFAHTGQGAGKLGTYSNHPVHLVVNGYSKATLDSSANFAVTGELEGGSLDINGNADISGALTLGTALAVAEGGTGATANTTWLNSNSFANFASSSADWDTLTTRGLYRFTGATNSPFGGSHATGFTLTEGSGNYGFQLASKGSANNQKYLAYRYRGTSWDDWQYLVTETYGDGRYLKLAGGTMTGALTLSGAPSSNLHAATKAYVDGAVIANTDTQDLSISGRVISLTNGGSVTVPETTIPTIPSGNQIIDWTTDQGSTNIHAGNYTDTNTQLTLNNTNTSTSTTEAATANAARVAYNRGSSGITAANSAQTTANAALPKAGGTMSGNIAMGNQNMTGVNEIEFDDGFKLFGGGNNNYLKAKAANTTNGGIIFQDGDSETMGYLYWDGSSTANFGLLDGTGSWAVRCRENEYVALYYDNATKLQTKGDGVDITGELQCDTLDVDGNADIAGNITSVVALTADQINLKDAGDYLTFYGDDGAQHSIASRQLQGGVGDDLRFNTYGSYIINLDSNNNQSSAANSSFYITKHGGADGNASGNVLFDIDGENGDATFTGNIDGVATLTATTFVGALTGNASGSSGSCTGNAATATLATAATTVTVTANSQDGSFYPTFVDATSGNENLRVDSGWSFNPSSNTMSVDRVTTATSTIRENNSNRAEGGVTGLPLMSLNGQGAGNAANISLHLAGDSTSSNVVKMRMTAVNGDDDLVGAGHLSYLATSDTFGIGQSTSHNQMAILIDNSDVVSMKNQTTFTNGIDVTSAVQSTSKTTGTVKIAGGLGVVKTLNVGEDVVAYASSDERYKDNLKPITNPIDKVKSLTGYTFTWNDKHEQFNGNDDIGVVAQEVEKVLPEIVDTRDNGYKAVKYEKMVALLIEAVKEQQTQIDGLKTIIDGYSK